MKPCWDPLQPPPVFNPGIIANVSFVLFALGFTVYLRALLVWKPSQSSPTSYGMGAHGLAMFLSTLTLVISLPRVILFGVFRAAAGMDARSGELACQLQDGIPIVPAILCFVLALLRAINIARLYARHRLAEIAGAALVPVASATERTAYRCAVLPAYRGVWIPPVANAFANAAKPDAGASPRPVTIYALDAFQTENCLDDDTWLRHNMQREGIRVVDIAMGEPSSVEEAEAPLLPAGSISDAILELRILWTSFARLPLRDCTLDLVVMPSFSFIPALTNRDESREKRDDRAVTLLVETRRVLLPGGRCVLVTPGNTSATEALCRRAGFEDVRTLPGSFYYSWMPSRVTVGIKPAQGDDLEKPVGAVPQRQTSASEPERSSLILRSQARSRHGPHWALWWPLMSATALLYALVVFVTWFFIDTLLVPSFLPYSNSVASLMINNVTFMPVAVYFMASTLTSFGDELDAGLADHSTAGHLHRTGLRVKMLQKFGSMLWNLFLGLTVLQLIGWAPTFIVDFALVRSGLRQADDLGVINTCVNLVIGVVLIPLGRRAWAWYEAWHDQQMALKEHKKQDEEEEGATAEAGEGAIPTGSHVVAVQPALG